MLERELEKNLDPPKKDIVSILKKKNPTPVNREALQNNSVRTSYSELETAGATGSLRRNRPPGDHQRECCVVL